MGDWHSLDALFEGYTECPDCGFHFVGCLALVFKKKERGKQLQNVTAHYAKKKGQQSLEVSGSCQGVI